MLYRKMLKEYNTVIIQNPGHSIAQPHIIDNKIEYKFKLIGTSKKSY